MMCIIALSMFICSYLCYLYENNYARKKSAGDVYIYIFVNDKYI